MFSVILKKRLTYVLLAFYVVLVIWWFRIFILGLRETNDNYWFGFFYPFIALAGGINGLLLSKKWGGYKSYVGRGIIFLSLGLLGEWFGQMVWSYHNIVTHIEVPYPSIADIGYFSIIPLYAFGIFCLARATGANLTLKTFKGKLIAIILPLIMVSISYFLFLKNLTPDFSEPLRTFLDFGYPLGEAITISIALLVYGLSRGVLGGKMKSRVLYLIIAFVVQYITDYTFLYKAAAGTYYNGGVVDLMYTTSFVVMALGLIAWSSYE